MQLRGQLLVSGALVSEKISPEREKDRKCIGLGIGLAIVAKRNKHKRRWRVCEILSLCLTNVAV
jgi:hypothetical protein